MTWLGALNFAVLQWLGVRLARIAEVEIFTKPPLNPKRDPVGVVRTVGWSVIGPVLPLTGWWSKYFPRRPRTIWKRLR